MEQELVTTLKHLEYMTSEGKVNVKRISKFLMSLNDTEFRYIRHTVFLAGDIRNFILDFKISKEEFCKEVGITEDDYQLYIRGAVNFSIDQLSNVQHYMIRKRAEAAGNIDLMGISNDE